MRFFSALAVCFLLALGFVYWVIRSDVPWMMLRPVVHKEAIDRYSGLYDVDPIFVMAIVKAESSFRHKAYSSKGAVGLMQLMPETANEAAKKIGLRKITLAQLETPELNLRLGIYYISELQKEFGADQVGVLAAYNAGPAVARLWKGSQKKLTIEHIPYTETRKFVKDVLTAYKLLNKARDIKKIVRR